MHLFTGFQICKQLAWAVNPKNSGPPFTKSSCWWFGWFGHWRPESHQGATLPPPTAPEAVVDNLRCHQWRLSRHHGNSRPSVGVLRVEISAKANLPLSQIPPPRRIDAWHATSVVLSSLDFSCSYGRAPTCQNRSWTGPMLTASDRYRSRRLPAREGLHG